MHLLVDGNALMHRSFHAVKFNPTYEGRPVGMVYGFVLSLLQALEVFEPSHIALGFDTKEKTFRHKMDQDYKAHRQKAPDEFYIQIPVLEACLKAFGLVTIKAPGFEADDIIGTLAVSASTSGSKAVIMSNDLDYCQLLGDHIQLCRVNGTISPDNLLDVQGVKAKLGVPPEQVIDFKAICGDSSDNYKGIEGIGPKGAEKLLTQYPTIDALYEHLEELPDKIRDKLITQKDYLLHCRTLARIKTDVPLPSQDLTLSLDQEAGIAFLEKLQFQSLARRLASMNKNSEQNNNNEHKTVSEKSDDEGQMSLF